MFRGRKAGDGKKSQPRRDAAPQREPINEKDGGFVVGVVGLELERPRDPVRLPKAHQQIHWAGLGEGENFPEREKGTKPKGAGKEKKKKNEENDPKSMPSHSRNRRQKGGRPWKKGTNSIKVQPRGKNLKRRGGNMQPDLAEVFIRIRGRRRLSRVGGNFWGGNETT